MIYSITQDKAKKFKLLGSSRPSDLVDCVLVVAVQLSHHFAI